jgi:hypothetical protein
VIESFAVINVRGVSTNKTIICFIAMQIYKELNTIVISTYTVEMSRLNCPAPTSSPPKKPAKSRHNFGVHSHKLFCAPFYAAGASMGYDSFIH